MFGFVFVRLQISYTGRDKKNHLRRSRHTDDNSDIDNTGLHQKVSSLLRGSHLYRLVAGTRCIRVPGFVTVER